MDIDISWIETCLIGRSLSEAEVSALKHAMKAVQLEKGTKILEQGQSGGVLFVLRSGSAEVQTHAMIPVSVATMGEGAVLGEMSFLTQDAASATVIAKTDCLAYCIDRAAFVSLMATQSELVFALFAYFLRHTAGVIRQMNDNHVSMLQYIGGGRMGV